MGLKETEFIKWVTDTSRIRHYHSKIKNEIIEFMVQLEVKLNDRWQPVVRYDTTHGFSHQALYYRDGRVEKIPLGISDYNIAMTFAENDLKRKWALYIQHFIKEAE